MRKHFTVLAMIMAVSTGVYTGSALAQGMEVAKRMPTTGATSAPIGFIQFCRGHIADCSATYSTPPVTQLSRPRWDQMVSVNRDVNRAVEPVTDEDQYGTAEYWTYPDSGKGDCEDYVLEKRRRLIALGWPAGSLLITVVRDQKNEGHAVLTVVTDRGDYVLDNQNAQVLSWAQTEYRYVKRQSQLDTLRWEGVEDRRTDVVASTRP